MNPAKLQPFISAYKEKQMHNIEEINFAAWLAGIYMSHSLAAVLGGGNVYPQKPISLFEGKEDSQSYVKDSEVFGAYAAMFNKAFNKEKDSHMG